MKARDIYLFICCIFFTVFSVAAQESSARKRTIAAVSSAVKLDTLTIFPNSFKAYCNNTLLTREQYLLDYTKGTFTLIAGCSDSITVEYRVLPMDLSKHYRSRDTSIVYEERKGNMDQYLVSSSGAYDDIFGSTSLKKNGSISRGISFGNNQDMSVNSTLNLELSGELAPNLKILASISDNKLPIQPDGNTNKLQEFDQIFIQLYNEKFKIIAGDFWLYRPKGYFLNYQKRAQGLYGEYAWKDQKNNQWTIQGSGALSKGKFARQIVQGIEGNQGPYRLRGNENEPFIIVLSGTEKVYVDGRLLERGQEFDYVVNYNTSEITFTSRNLITKDSRIVIEFQYSDQNYARSLFQASTSYSSEKLDFWMNAYSEQDAKNQSIQQSLSLSQKQLLASIGDSLELARVLSIDSVGFQENQNLYKMIDSLGIDSVLVYSVNPSLAVYRATFVFVGNNQGDYVMDNFNALGRVYRWVAPVNGVRQGNYVPARVLITPKQKQMVNMGVAYRLNKKLALETEFVYSKNDINTFSKKDAGDDAGVGNRTRIKGAFPLGKDSVEKWSLVTVAELEALQRNFVPIEQYRSVEYDRDWNTRNRNYKGNQFLSSISADFRNQQHGNIGVEAAQYSIGKDYSGLKSRVFGNWRQKRFSATGEGSYLLSDGWMKNEFLRHRMDVSQSFKKIKFGFKDDQERNTYRDSSGLNLQSYQFFDYEFYVGSADSSKLNYRVFYRERAEQRSDGMALKNVSKARNAGGELTFISAKTQRLNLLVNYRELKVNDNVLLPQTPENTLLGRVDYELKLFKNTITWNTFYEVGSGLEQKRLFQYIKVPDGQGVYTWIDYNGDGIKDLNEFEIAQYADQASYIRVFIPSDEYSKTYSNEFNQSIFIRPERIWSGKSGFKKLLARFSDQARFRVYRKTSHLDQNSFNPFASEVRDTTLISTNSNIRNSFFFNRTSSIFGAEYVVQDIRSKNLLANGFDARQNTYHELNFRWNIKRKFTLETTAQKGTKSVDADYTSGRNYDIAYYFIKPAFSYQPSTSFRLTLETRYSDKRNVEGEHAVVNEIGLRLKFNQAEKGSLQAAFALVNIKYNGLEGTSLGFEMLESLKTGKNFTWNAGYQRSISKNLQISIQYNGRKSETNKAIHSGGMEVRAFF